MKSLREHLKESLLINERFGGVTWQRMDEIRSAGIAKGGSIEKSIKKPVFKPETSDELLSLIEEMLEYRGMSGDYNDIDTSAITDMSYLFYVWGDWVDDFRKFNGNISKWDVSNVTNMEGMFQDNIKFNKDISKWDVSNVKNMKQMFKNSKFNGNISKWDVSSVESMEYMFERSSFNGDISKWDVSNVVDMCGMFERSSFNGDISKWDVSNVEDMDYMFDFSKLEGNEPEWYKGE